MATRTVDYGTDLFCGYGTTTLDYPDATTRTSLIVDIDEGFTEVSGRTQLMQALVRRLITPRSTLPGDPNYGTDLRRWLNSDVDATTITNQIAAETDAELLQDERVKRSSTVATYDGTKLTTTITVTDAAGPFKLVLAITDVSIKVLEGP
jgi:phage baseplate assembly protein W